MNKHVAGYINILMKVNTHLLHPCNLYQSTLYPMVSDDDRLIILLCTVVVLTQTLLLAYCVTTLLRASTLG